MQYTSCRHIKANGLSCKSPSLNDSVWCYFHARLHQRHNRFRFTEAVSDAQLRTQHVQLHPIEDRESIQVALSLVINALASGQMESRRATALFYGLQLASSNAVGLNILPYAPNVVRSVESTPEGLDLAQSGTTSGVKQIGGSRGLQAPEHEAEREGL